MVNFFMAQVVEMVEVVESVEVVEMVEGVEMVELVEGVEMVMPALDGCVLKEYTFFQ